MGRSGRFPGMRTYETLSRIPGSFRSVDRAGSSTFHNILRCAYLSPVGPFITSLTTEVSLRHSVDMATSWSFALTRGGVAVTPMFHCRDSLRKTRKSRYNGHRLVKIGSGNHSLRCGNCAATAVIFGVSSNRPIISIAGGNTSAPPSHESTKWLLAAGYSGASLYRVRFVDSRRSLLPPRTLLPTCGGSHPMLSSRPLRICVSPRKSST